MASTSTSSGVHAQELLLFFTLIQLVLIVAAGRLGDGLSRWTKQSRAVGEIIMGIVLGPSLLGWIAPEAFNWIFKSTPGTPMQILSQISLLLLMFQIGLEFDFAHLSNKTHRKSVGLISLFGIAIPFGLGLVAANWVPMAYQGEHGTLGFSLFFATAMSITALPILGRIMMEFRLTRTPLGVIAISSAAINDVAGWLILAVITTLMTSGFDPQSFALKVVSVVGFGVLSWVLIRPILLKILDRQMSVVAENSSSQARTQSMPDNAMALALCAIFLGGMATYQLGIFAIFGGFMMGVLLHDRPAFVKSWNDRVGQFVNVFFLPIFFTYTGLRTDIGSLNSLQAWGWCAGVIAIATLGKFGGCYLASRVSGLNHSQSKVVGIMMNTRALMELIVLNVGYDLGVMSREMFTMLVIMALFSTVVTTPALRRWLPSLGLKNPDDHSSVPTKASASKESALHISE